MYKQIANQLSSGKLSIVTQFASRHTATGTHMPYGIAVLRLNSTTRARPDPRGPARTLTETSTGPTEFLGDPGRKKVRSGPVGSV